MAHLEDLLAEYYEWLGHVVKCNMLVGKRDKGGYEMELDVLAYEPKANRILHIEPSLDSDSWERREQRFIKKFVAGQKYILKEIFQWLPKETQLVQRAVFPSASAKRRLLAGAEVVTVDEMIAEIRSKVKERGLVSRSAISERYPLLRMIQFVENGYYRRIETTTK